MKMEYFLLFWPIKFKNNIIYIFFIIIFIAAPFFAQANDKEYNIGDEIELIGSIIVSKGYVFKTECIKISGLSRAILKDINDEKIGFGLIRCSYALGDPRHAPNFPLEIGKFIGKDIKLVARIGVSYDNAKKEVAPQVNPGEIIFLYPLKIEEIKEERE